MVTIPNQSSIPKAWLEFNSNGQLPEGPFYARIVDVMEELVKFTWLVRGRAEYLVDRYSERVETRRAVQKCAEAGVEKRACEPPLTVFLAR